MGERLVERFEREWRETVESQPAALEYVLEHGVEPGVIRSQPTPEQAIADVRAQVDLYRRWIEILRNRGVEVDGAVAAVDLAETNRSGFDALEKITRAYIALTNAARFAPDED